MVGELGKPIALGRTAEIYAWEEGQVLKLFYAWMSAQDVEHEARLAHAIHASGLAIPAVHETLSIGNRHAIVYERVDGISMLELLQRKPWDLALRLRQMAELHAEMHQKKIDSLPRQRDRLRSKIINARPLSPDLRQAALQALEALPDDDCLCHGDFHPGNILIAARGPVIIDWIDATSGHPIGDLARTWVLFNVASSPPGSSIGLLIWLSQHFFLDRYLKHYFQITGNDPHQLEAWIPVVAAARLSEGIVEEINRTLALVSSRLAGPV